MSTANCKNVQRPAFGPLASFDVGLWTGSTRVCCLGDTLADGRILGSETSPHRMAPLGRAPWLQIHD